jgi:nitrite reductase (NO-forming)
MGTDRAHRWPISAGAFLLALAVRAQATSGLPAWQAVAGQRATCAGPSRKSFSVDMVEHIKMGMAGVMIVYPRSPALPPARELVVMRNGVYGSPSPEGVIAADSKAMERNAPTFFIFNGSLAHQPIAVPKGQRVRVYFVNAGPGVASFHVIGTILDTVRLSGNPSNTLRGVQTVEVGAGNGASIDVTIPEAVKFLLVDHDQLAHLADGFVIPFVAE